MPVAASNPRGRAVGRIEPADLAPGLQMEAFRAVLLKVDEFNAARLKMTAESTPHRQRARTLTTRSSLTAPRTSAQWPTRRTRPRRS